MACVRKWRGNWVVDWRDPVTRKRCIETVEDNNRDAAKRRLSEILKSGERGANKRLAFKEYGTYWLENCAKGNIKESTYEEYERSLRVHLYDVLGEKPLTAITRKMVRELITKKRKAGLSQSTVRNMLAPMRGMYNQAIEDGDAFHNPAERLGKFNKKGDDKPPINPLTREETQILLDKALTDFSHYYPLFLCAPRSGLRQGELIALKGIDLDFSGNFIDVQRTLSRGKITSPKSGKTRRVDMSKQLSGVLNELLSKRRAAALRREMEKPAAERRETGTVINEVMEDWVFTTAPGTQLDPSNMRKVFNTSPNSRKASARTLP